MIDSKTNSENIVATESFEPSLNEYYEYLFRKLVLRLGKALRSNHRMILKNEIDMINQNADDNDIECLKYKAALSVLIDLEQQGWLLEVVHNSLKLRMENEIKDDKEAVRYRLSAERNAQFRSESIADFIKKMESDKEFNGEVISIKALIGDPKVLIEAIEKENKVCDPYLQPVTQDKDIYSGYRLSDIWRYFRYTWAIPYKTMPGRNLYYLVRDRNQKHHPIMGIFALGNSVLNLTVRDDDIGWTVDAIKRNLTIRSEDSLLEQIVSGTDGGIVKTSVKHPLETIEEYESRVNQYADTIFPLLVSSIRRAIDDLYVKDFNYTKQTRYPKQETVIQLSQIEAEYSEKAINNRNTIIKPNWEDEAQSNLFKRKRAAELAKLLSAQIVFNSTSGSCYERLNQLLSKEIGRKAIKTALISNRKCKIGSNMMDIIVCGAIPPYNELLGGKLVSILACSPSVIRDYTLRYKKQVSEIASRMKGKKVIRDSHLVYLGTTSLYAIGSSQYNRIKVPLWNGDKLEFRKMGITEGYGTVFFSRETTSLFSRILELCEGGRRINNVFGEGTSPRFRMISKGLRTIGIKADTFLHHYSPRIVYSIDLAKNTKEYLLGLTDEVDYGLDIENKQQTEEKTQYLIDYWYRRWLSSRLSSVDIVKRLEGFNPNNLLMGNIAGGAL